MNNRIIAAFCAAYLLATTFALAETEIDEITVTADLRGRSLMDVTYSVSAVDGDAIQELAVQHFEELIDIVPNMNWSGDGHRARYFQIRGVGELEQYQGAPDPSIGFLVDDIDFSGIGTIATLFDVESVEVIRGPQGSRYGANALGGLVYVSSTAPETERNGKFELTLGSDNARSVGVAFGGAIDRRGAAAYRLSAQNYRSDGFRTNPFLGIEDSNGRDETSVRGSVETEFADGWTGRLSLLYANIDNGYDAFALDNGLTVLSDRPGRDAQESIGASLRLEWQLAGDLTVTSISALADSDIQFDFDADWGNPDSWSPFVYDFVSVNSRSRRTLSQEIRIGKERWLLGVYALRLDDILQTLNLGDYDDPINGFSDTLDSRFDSDYRATNVAVFGQHSIAFSDATELSSGLRIERRNTDYVDTAGLDVGPSETMWGAELSLNRRIDDRTVVYISASRGYKAGGFNLGATPPGKQAFDAESMLTLELGLRARLLDGDVSIDAAAFRYTRDDQQVRGSEQLIPGDPASFVFFTDNVGSGTGIGFEADLRWYPADEWELYAALGLLEAETDSGRLQAHAPRYTLAAGAAYRHPGGFFARADLVAKDEYFFDVSHDQKSSAYHLVNLRLGIERDKWLLSLWARNLADEDYAVRGFYFGNEPPNFPNTLYTRRGDPRQYGLTLQRRF